MVGDAFETGDTGWAGILKSIKMEDGIYHRNNRGENVCGTVVQKILSCQTTLKGRCGIYFMVDDNTKESQ